MVTFFDKDSEQAQMKRELTQAGMRSALSAKVISGAAAYDAMASYGRFRTGKGPISRAQAKSMTTALSDKMVDVFVATAQLAFVDGDECKRAAREQCENVLLEKENFRD